MNASSTPAVPGTIAIVHESPKAAMRLAATLAPEALEILSYTSAEDLLANGVDPGGACVVAPSDLGGMGVRGLLERIRERALPLRVVVLAHAGEIAVIAALLRAGACDIVDPDAPGRLRAAIREALA